MFVIKLPAEAKVMRRLIGLSKALQKLKVIKMNKHPTTEMPELTRSMVWRLNRVSGVMALALTIATIVSKTEAADVRFEMKFVPVDDLR